MKIAIEGCCHGQLDNIYSSVADLEAQNNYRVDLLLICGDFQAIRNEKDLQCMAVPEKYKQLGGFHKYYTGEKVAPILTLIIGGNHEASNYFWELFHGGWVAPNIYFLGNAGSVLVNGLRIAGASGIFKGYNFSKGYFERQPYSKDDLRSIYHIRESAVRQLSLLPSSTSSSPTTIFLSHDWPLNITSYASPSNLSQLLRKKPFFKQEVSEGKLGSPPLMGLFQVLKPRWWFSAHLHVGFDVRVWWEAEVPAVGDRVERGQAEEKVANPDEIVIDDDDFESLASDPHSLSTTAAPIPPTNPDEITLDDLDGDAAFDVAVPPPPLPTLADAISLPRVIENGDGWFTQFVALDKCLPRRKFLEVVDVDTTETPLPRADVDALSSSTTAPLPSNTEIQPVSPATTTTTSQPTLTFDPHWLAITRAFHSHISLTHQQTPFPDEAIARDMVSKELEWVKGNVREEGKVRIEDVQQFVQTAPGPEGGGSGGAGRLGQPPPYLNPQTEAFCRMLMVHSFVNPGASSS
ncbi:lariat debranching enzyme, C-terminal domain-containing protein [Lentinula aciculospora]|uniref:Lariat debranching enzyme, C-terminal domain-containing protein n=1 Tax=Lentinula aciculospora TaxID=153920 RepID=A0A9W9ALV1_9AGAR|nr:lariat debranching enzyme, C-terminal domain-containing protein [Lentinula aciculospora]